MMGSHRLRSGPPLLIQQMDVTRNGVGLHAFPLRSGVCGVSGLRDAYLDQRRTMLKDNMEKWWPG